MPEERQFLKDAFQAVGDAPLQPDDPWLVPVHGGAAGGDDPVERLARSIELSSGESVQLFSGFRGTGKSTELGRLESRLVGAGYKVALVDMDECLNPSSPLDVSEFLIALAGEFSDEMAAPDNLGQDPTQESYWRRLSNFLTTTELDLPGAAVFSIGVNLRSDPTFQERLRNHLKGRLGSLVDDVHRFFAQCVQRLRKRHGPDTEVVLLVDSLEHIRGTSLNAREVQESMATLFGSHADKLRIPDVHVVYTFPPYLKARSVNAGVLRGLGAMQFLSAVQVRDPRGALSMPGIRALGAVAAHRLDTARLFGDDSLLQKVILSSGGNLRDLLRLLREVLRRARSLPVDPQLVDEAIESMRVEFLPLPDSDVPALARIALEHELVLEVPSRLDALSRWDDGHLVLMYRDGREWYDVHPLLRDVVLERARELRPEVLPARASDPTPSSPRLPPAAPSAAAPAALTPDMHVTLLVENYRALRRVRWTFPRGVSALVGPNGSGKTTLLDMPELLRHALEHDVRKAIDDRGGPGNLRSAQADRKAAVILGVELDDLGWRLDLSPKGASYSPLHGERATVGPAVAFDRPAHVPDLELRSDDGRPFLARFAELPEGAVFRPLVTLLKGYRLYHAYDLASIRVNGSQLSSDEHLHPDGRNIFSVLRNWRDRKETRARWNFVTESLQAAFPDTFDALDFDMAGQTVSGRMLAPQPDVSIPTYFAANGWLVALLHLAAVASTDRASAVAIDEVENGLHPYAIRQLINAMRRWAEETGISIVLATHSPVVIDQFKETPEQIFVMEPGRETTPVPLDELHDPEWLAHFSLGDLYAHDEYGAQHRDDERVA